MSKFVEACKAHINRLSHDWLRGHSKDENMYDKHLHVVANFVGWSVAAPLLSLILFLPQFSLPTSLSLSLIVAGVFMLASGIVCQTGQVKTANALVLSAISVLISLLVLKAGGISSLYLSLFVLLPLEAKYIGNTRSAFSTGLAAAGASIVAIIALQFGQVVTLTPDPTHELSILSSVLLILGSYAVIRSGLLHAEPDHTTIQAFEAKPIDETSGIISQIIDTAIYNKMAGLVTRHNLNGDVLSVHGLEPDLICTRSDNLVGQGYLNQIHISDRIAYLSAIDDLRQGNPAEKILLRFEARHADEAQFRYVQANLMGLFNNNGDLREFYIQSQDITPYISAMDKIEALEVSSHENEITKTRFLAGVSHELRTPLNSILGFSDVLLHEVIAPLPDERHREYVSLIRQSGEHLLNVVNTMLDMSKIQNGHYQLHCDEFELAPLLERTKAMLNIQARKKDIDLTCRIAKGLPDLNADNRALTQIIINLVGNAVKFTQKGGVVSVDAEMDGHDFILRVSDTGIGIPQDKLSKIGQPFMQVDSSLAREFEGTGLGLSLVKGLVELHNGEFSIESVLGEGTEVTVRIPQLHEELENHTGSENDAQALVGAVYKGGEANVA